MNAHGFDADALITQFSEASAKQGEALRRAVQEATLKALQGRELTLKNIKATVKQVTSAAATGAGGAGEGAASERAGESAVFPKDGDGRV